MKLYGEVAELVEGARLEIVFGFTPNEGSNPSLSAKNLVFSTISFYFINFSFTRSFRIKRPYACN